jgi:hypothetical protein
MVLTTAVEGALLRSLGRATLKDLANDLASGERARSGVWLGDDLIGRADLIPREARRRRRRLACA